MVRGQNAAGATRHILSDAERTGIEDEREELKTTLAEAKEFGAGTKAEQLNKDAIAQQIKHLDKVLDEGERPTLGSKKRDDLIREGKNLIEILQRGYPTRDEMRFPSRYPDAVNKHLKWCHTNEKAIERYKFLRSVINDGDLLPHLENLRKEK